MTTTTTSGAADLPEPLSKRPSEANTLVWVADPISSTGVRGVFVDDITCLWWWGAGLIFQKEADAAALALRMRSAIASHGPAQAQADSVLEDAARLDYLHSTGSTIEMLPGEVDFYPMRFRVGGLHSAVSPNLREAIDIARKQGANHGR